jgi:predicted hotdog family 3-hydroxylacyl-ACP dehydratase
MTSSNHTLTDPEASMPATSFPPIETIVPHRGTMLLLDAVIACSSETLTARAGVDSGAWYANAAGEMPAWIGIELMAQAIAAHVSLLAMQAGAKARPGVLLGSNRYTAHVPAFTRETPLLVEARELLKIEAGHGAYECRILSGGACRAEAVIKVFQPDHFKSFIEGSVKS